MPPILDQPAIPFFRYASVRIYIGCQGVDRKWPTCSQIDASDPKLQSRMNAPCDLIADRSASQGAPQSTQVPREIELAFYA
jgi:hypothetical protein